jgi:hypothetical protein
MTRVTPIRRWLWLAIVGSLLVGMLPALAPTAAASEPNEDGSYGFRAQAYTSTADRVTGEKPEAKLWFHDARWWATMIPEDGTTHTIHELAGTTWVDTGVEVAGSTAARGDALLVGDALYISNRGTSTLFRANWDGSRWVPRGTPSDLPVPADTPALTIAKDSTGTLWLTWVEDDGVHVAWAPDQTELSAEDWTNREMTSLEAVGDRAAVSDDDISAVIAFTDAKGPAIGVMWSNQRFRQQFFAIHRDGATHDAWSLETIGAGETREADDHINLKTHAQTVYAAIKTEHSANSPDPSLIKLLVRSPTGTWEDHVVAVYDESDTRPIAVLEVTSRYAYVFMTRNPEGDQRHIVYKRARLTDVAVDADVADPFEGPVTFIRSDSTRGINDATSMKANATAESGIVVLASTSQHYWWNRIDIDAPPPPTYRLTTSVEGEGAIELDPAEGPYSQGTAVQVSAVADDGWSFAGWSGDLTGDTNPTSVLMDGAKSITATFTADPLPTYELTTSVVGEGAIELDPAEGPYSQGTAVQVSAVADDGWSFAGWSGDLTGDTNPTSVLMDGAKSITATFTADPTPPPPVDPPRACDGVSGEVPFRDHLRSQHREHIECLAAHRITVGYADGTYRPYSDITRAEMATMLVRWIETVQGTPLPEGEAGRFTDTGQTTHRANIDKLATLGIARGVTATSYAPHAEVTRGQMASFVARVLSYLHDGQVEPISAPPATTTGWFPDRDATHGDNIDRLASVGIVLGYEDGLYRPMRPVERGAMAAYIVRAWDYHLAEEATGDR